MFLLLWWLFKRVSKYGQLASIFVIGYGLFRFIVEFFREPDAQLGYYFNYFTMGQILCVAMIVGGGLAYVYLAKNGTKISRTV